MGGASTFRDAVEAAGSRLEVSVRELCHPFGISHLTAAGRDRIARELGAVGLRLEQSLARLGLDERIIIFDPRPGLVSIATHAEPVLSMTPEPRERPRRSFWSNRRRAVMAGVGVGLLVILLAGVFGSNVGKEGPEGGSIQAREAAASPPAIVSPPTTASTRGRSEVVASLREVDAALVQDDTDSARRILGSIDAGVLADPDLALEARILRNRVRFTESYLAATALAESGRYREARERMLALIPFRDAGIRARLYGVEIAKDLVTQARTEAPVDPDRALALLDQAEDLAPSLSSITEVRTEATGR